MDLSFGKNIGKSITNNWSGKNSQKLFDHIKQPATNALKSFSKRVIEKTVEATGDLIGNKSANKTTKVQMIFGITNNSETVTNEHNEGSLKERHTHIHTHTHTHTHTYIYICIYIFMVIIKHSYPIIPFMVAWLLILLGNHGTKRTNHILHKVSAFAFF